MNTEKVISEKKRTLIFINILICCIATSLLFTALTTALPAVSRSLQISVSTGQWLTSGYSLAMGIIMPLTAFLIKRFQTKKLYITGISIFMLDLIIMVVAFICACNVFDNVLKTEESKFDFTSFILSIFAFGGITLGIGNISSLGITDHYTWIPLVIGIIGSIIFTFYELRLDTPFLDMRIFKTKEFTLSVIGSILLYFIMMGSSVLMPLYVQSLKGYSATISGFVTLPGSLVMAVISPIVGKVYDKIGIRKLFIYGSLLLMLCNFGMYFITLNTSIIVAAVLNALRCAAIGCLMMPLVTWGTMNVRKEKVSDATAILSSLRTIGGAIGAAVFVC